MATQPNPFITPEEYLARERVASFKSEYYRGEVFAMAGASRAHVLIVTNLVAELRNRLRAQDCLVFSTDMRLRADTSYVYPDVMVVCGKAAWADQDADMLTNPVLIIEVLSESTKDYDRAGKFDEYMQIQSLAEYITVSQAEMLADHWVRQPDDSWLFRQIGAKTGALTINIPILGIDIPLADIYDKVELAPR